jgi:hypothetical protein
MNYHDIKDFSTVACTVCGEFNLETQLCFNCKSLLECLNCCGCEELEKEEESEQMEEGALIDLIEEAIHTDGSLLTDGEVLDIIEKLLEKRERASK